MNPAIALLAAALLPTAASAQTLSAPDAHAAIKEKLVVLVDIRTPIEWRSTGVPAGAKRVDMAQGAQKFLEGILEAAGGNRNAPIALICRTGNRTTQALRFLKTQGFQNAFHIPEGMAGSAAGPGWVARGLPIEKCGAC